jgi:polyisoprenoid-binding protein YceI
MKYRLFLLLFLLPVILLVSADRPAKDAYILSRNYEVTIDGTSSLRDWTEKVGDVTGDMTAMLNEDGSVGLSSIRICMRVLSIKSDMGRVMDNKTYEALKATAHPEILFTISVPMRLVQVRDGKTAIPVKGELTLAGVCKPVTMLVKTFEIRQGNLSFEGSQRINMSDYGVKPPSALFGTMRAGPEITIHFNTNFINQSILTNLKN